jgi:hypothetical protein
MRIDGLVCTGGPEIGFSAAWIGIDNTAETSITQIGFIHQWDSALGTGIYCRFWAIDGGGVHDYGCGNTSDDTFVYFQVQRFTDPITHADFYDILDCGTAGGYGNCTSKDSQQVAYTSAFGVLGAESDYGKSACTIRIMGSTSDKQNFGTSTFTIEGMHGAGSWGNKTWSGQGAVCNDYGGNTGNFTRSAWDTRN